LCFTDSDFSHVKPQLHSKFIRASTWYAGITLMCKELILLEQGFPAWGTCIPKGTFADLKGHI